MSVLFKWPVYIAIYFVLNHCLDKFYVKPYCNFLKVKPERRSISDSFFFFFAFAENHQIPKCFWKAAHGMQGRNGDPSGDKSWTRVHYWHQPVLPAPQWVPGKRRLPGQMEGSLSAGVFTYALRPANLTAPPVLSFLGRVKNSLPNPLHQLFL